jgi:rRNA maturation endonuclease Nob1
MKKLFDMQCIDCEDIVERFIDETELYFCDKCDGKLKKKLTISKKIRPMSEATREVEDMVSGNYRMEV